MAIQECNQLVYSNSLVFVFEIIRCSTYPYEMLKLSSNQLLKGVDRTQLECYLSSDEFESLFKMRLDTFQRLPEWKRNDLKKKLDLL
ncbi:Actin-binding LIM protein [Schistosoma japonicum]|uniref:Actin-binding LIM protein n=1 Tax=Schistosoma japonicum TaxID=6182 RepID=A0A4Z2DQ11_SCHJA|nr:Actin-binding LIM protein [Schistosoma japonicum]